MSVQAKDTIRIKRIAVCFTDVFRENRLSQRHLNTSVDPEPYTRHLFLFVCTLETLADQNVIQASMKSIVMDKMKIPHHPLRLQVQAQQPRKLHHRLQLLNHRQLLQHRPATFNALKKASLETQKIVANSIVAFQMDRASLNTISVVALELFGIPKFRDVITPGR